MCIGMWVVQWKRDNSVKRGRTWRLCRKIMRTGMAGANGQNKKSNDNFLRESISLIVLLFSLHIFLFLMFLFLQIFLPLWILFLQLHLLNRLNFLRNRFLSDSSIGLFIHLFVVLGYKLLLPAFLSVEDIFGKMPVHQDSLYFSILSELIQKLFSILYCSFLALIDIAWGTRSLALPQSNVHIFRTYISIENTWKNIMSIARK